ncbi:4-(cytidine 5'-diphospho)-2-C-methyl-D-erythritol kinase [Persicitalea jodogahamensis]|uniref:4-diphosphocytidyl-2-C-methyl-D-erythritol kinase n=1 Tax=Persicitalea jodogahamensis TaxID=402147 RepID=A0A8J3G7L6_9BACT|nr:4-(cytidine 5'-diphospho)-2-C-methyl-D-erythritol kinase [Persicitalea jodogahamensis]GHB51933.1 4-diphosphocytidyl-2-C-methyl-D-erythritol kinase [Persicitalea jodogahamensis]
MVTFPNAKINIGLNIVGKRPDGFHNLESCFYPVGWADALEILPQTDWHHQVVSFTSSGLSIPGNQDSNLCLKAYRLLAEDFALPPVSIHLLKAVPIGAGLGGGSADAAFTIKALNQLFSLDISTENQQKYARSLGSDCAFFIENKPMYCFGKGDQFEETSLRLTGKWILLVNPGLHISTAEAYSGITPRVPTQDLRELLQKPIGQWRDFVKNDFEESLFKNHSVLPQIKAKIYDLGAQYASMSGSGSTVYGIFDHEPDPANNFQNSTVWKGELN